VNLIPNHRTFALLHVSLPIESAALVEPGQLFGVYPQHAAWAGTGNADAAEKLVTVYGASLELPTKDGRTALHIAKEQKQTSTEQKLLLLAAKAAAERAAAAEAQAQAPKDAKRLPESSPEPSTSKKAKLAEATEETGDVFRVWPTPMTGGDDKWSQFLSPLKPKIVALTSILVKSDLFMASVLRTSSSASAALAFTSGQVRSGQVYYSAGV
jgi:hypothetical protein